MKEDLPKFTFNLPGDDLPEDYVKQFQMREVVGIELSIDMFDGGNKYYIQYNFDDGGNFKLEVSKHDFETMQL